MTDKFRALLIEKHGEGREAPQSVRLAELNQDDLMPGDVVVDVDHSTVNYKDGLAITGASPVVRRFPMIPGIDLAGTVRHSDHADYNPGDQVVLNGWGVGETHMGGHAERARVKGDWLVPLPGGMTSADAMAIGTAGYTAMLCVLELERHEINPQRGPVLVTGAAGGVGSVAIALLSNLGYRVIASTGRASESAYLKHLGADEIIDREELSEKGKPLAKPRWAGAIDTVGSTTLANVLAATEYGGAVAACGLAGGGDLPASVMPFILRGVTLAGVDSVMAPKDKRLLAWGRLADDLDRAKLHAMSQEIGLGHVVQAAENILKGKIRGRMVVDVKA